MGFISFLIVGLIAGAIAKAIMPGSSEKPSGWFMTMILGVVGAFVGGFLGSLIFPAAASAGSFSILGILFSVIGAVAVIAILRLVTGKQLSS